MGRLFSTLWFRLMLLGSAAVVTALLLAMRADYQYRQLVVASIEGNVLNLARVGAGNQERMIAQTRLLLTDLATRPVLRSGPPETCNAVLRDYLKHARGYRNFGLTDLQGNVLASAVPLARATNWASGRWFRATLQRQDFAAGDYQLGRVTGKPSLHFGMPVRDASGKTVRLVYCAVDTARIAELCEAVPLPAEAVLTVMDCNGVILARLPESGQWAGRSAAEWALFREAAAGHSEGTHRAAGLDRVDRLYAYKTVATAGADLHVVMGWSEALAFADLDRITRQALRWLVLVAAGVLVLASLFAQALVIRPVHTLREATRRVTAGDRAARAGAVAGAGELGELAAAFDEMAGALQREQAETQRAQEALERENAFVTTVLSTLGALVVVLDGEGRIVRFNHACEQATGYSQEEVRGRRFFEFLLVPEETEAVRQVFATLRAGMFPSSHENYWVARDGTRRRIAWTNSTIVDAAGEVEFVVATGIDVTEQRAAEEGMVRANSVLKALRDVNDIVRVEQDRERLLQACCDALLAGRGYTKAWLATSSRAGEWEGLYSSGMGERHATLAGMLREQTLPPCAPRGEAPGTVVVWEASDTGCAGCALSAEGRCPTRMTTYLAHEERVYGVLCVCLPLDMEATTEEQELLREMAEVIAMALYALELAEAEGLAQRHLALERDRLAALHRLNEMAEANLQEITDFALEEAVRLTSSTIGYLAFMSEDESVLTMHSWSKSAMAECAIIDKPIVYPVVSTGLWGEAVRQRQPVFTNDYQAPNPLKRGYPEGHVHVGRHMNIPVFDGERIVAVAGVGNKEEPYDDSDVVQLQLLMGGMWRLLHRKQAAEDLRRAHDQLEQRVEERTAELARSNSELEQFAYIASHDLQEPLRKIVAFGDRLVTKHGGALPEEGHDYLARMQNAAQRMQSLINDLLAYSRVTTHAQAFVPVALARVVQEVQSDLEVAIERSGGTIQAVDLPTLDADPLQMRQLFQNLISNALKFQRADAPPVVEITAELFTRETSGPWDMYPAVPMCRLKFKDNGIGFEPRHGERIFDIFQRLHTRDEYEGTGIGLALCRKIVERHGGSIAATGEAGVGATFTVILPVKHAGGERTPLGT